MAALRAFSASTCGKNTSLLLEDAIRKFTSLPAQQVKLQDRGSAAHRIFRRHHHLRSRQSQRRGDLRRPEPHLEWDSNTFSSTECWRWSTTKSPAKWADARCAVPATPCATTCPMDCRPRGKVQGVVTDEGDIRLPRSTVTLTDQRARSRHREHQERWPLRDRARTTLPWLFAQGRTDGLRRRRITPASTTTDQIRCGSGLR